MGLKTRALLAAAAACFLALGLTATANAGAIEHLAGCETNTLAPNDDGSTGTVALPFTLNFFGNNYTNLYVNNNGNVTFDGPLSTYTPFPILTTRTPILAPFFGDVDTRSFPASDLVRYGATTFGGHPAFCVNWDGVGVGYYSFGTDKLNKFQLLIVSREDIEPGAADVYFNYDQIQWEAGSASGGVGGLGGNSARAGYSNGTSSSLELPGSAINGAYLDSNLATGLIHNSRDSFVLGRYLFPIRNGIAPVGGTISGHIWGNTVGNGLAAAFIQLCSATRCQTTQSTAGGGYSFTGLPDDTYDLVVFPPGTGLSGGGLNGLAIFGANTLNDQDVLLTGPTPPPPGTGISPSHGGAVPTVYWGDTLNLTTTACTGGTGTWEIVGTGWSVSGTMTETPPGSGNYTGTVPPFFPNHGNAHVTITINCPGGATSLVAFDIYIDPSGVVLDTNGRPVPGATVTLYRADDTGTFVPVPDGSAIMSPSNRNNPDTTDAAGHFGWDVIAGRYLVRASAPDCHAPGNEAQPFVETDVLTIPPPVTDLVLVLECPVRDPDPPVTTATRSPDANAAGWANTDVLLTLTADDGAGSGVDQMYYAVDDSACAPGSLAACNTYAGPTAIATEGRHVVTFFSTDLAGNVEAAQFLEVWIDKTAPPAPTVAADRAPDFAGGGGWYRDVLTTTAYAGDDPALADGTAGSGVDPSTLTAPQTFASSGSHTYAATVKDRAGNESLPATLSVQVDADAPQLTADATSGGTAYAPGTWTNKDVIVTFHCTDGQSGVASSTAPVTVSSEGANQSVNGSCSDNVGHSAAASFGPINLDKTPPEAAVQFDPAHADIDVFGHDALAGIGAAALDPASTEPAAGNRELRTYRLADAAGNSLVVRLLVKQEGKQLKASIADLAYGGAAASPAVQNELKAEWSLDKDGNLKQLQQQASLGTASSSAHYDGTQTRFAGGPTLPGLVLLRLVTQAGGLAIQP